MADIIYEIKEKIGTISESPKGWKRELNLVSWNNKEPKFDLRDSSPKMKKWEKGLPLTNDELKALKILLNEMEL